MARDETYAYLATELHIEDERRCKRKSVSEFCWREGCGFTEGSGESQVSGPVVVWCT